MLKTKSKREGQRTYTTAKDSEECQNEDTQQQGEEKDKWIGKAKRKMKRKRHT